MRILITGGSGLIGRALAAELAGDHEVVVLSRRPQRVSGLPEGVRAAGWDGVSAEGWGELVDRDTAIVHLAGENVAAGRWSAERKRRLRESRIDSGRAVLAAVEAAAEKPRALLQGSAVGYYGDRGDERLDEGSAPGEGFLAELSVEWEGVTAPAEELGVRRVLLRTGVVLDPDGGALPKMAMPFRFFLGAPLGDGRHWVPWIHRDDEVAAIRFLLEQETTSGPYNLCAPEPLTNRDFSRALARALKRPCFPLGPPRAALHLVVGEMAEMLLASQRVLPRRLVDAGFAFRFPEIGPALSDLLG